MPDQAEPVMPSTPSARPRSIFLKEARSDMTFSASLRRTGTGGAAL